MAETTNPPATGIDPKTRARLQQWFTKGTQCATKGDNQYAVEMFSQCVLGDPGNRLYVDNLIGSLRKIYNNNGKGAAMSGMRTASTKATIKKNRMSKAWKDVLKNGIEVLKINPWDTGTLVEMAEACEKLEAQDGQLGFMDAAWTSDPKSYEINFKYGEALISAENFEKAVVCFQRAAKAKPDEPDARRMMAWCSGKIAELDFSDREETQSTKVTNEVDPNSEEALLKKMRKEPGNAGTYMELAELYSGQERYDEAEKILQKALTNLDGEDVGIRESLENAQLNIFRDRFKALELDANKNPSPAKQEHLKKLMVEKVKRELVHYKQRVERYPNNTHYQFELGKCLQKTGQFKEAIAAFQVAKSDTSRKAETLLELGKCFFKIKQHQLALSHFAQGIDSVDDEHSDMMKELLYLTGKLAAGLGEKAKAREYLHRLAGLDFSYRDVSELLDKLGADEDTA